MELSHHKRGAGDLLVLVHGLGGRWETWSPVLDALAAHREVIAVDLPGHGGSAMLSDEAPTVAALARAIVEFVGSDGFDVAGYSVGGAVALELGRAGQARSVCAICPIGFWTPREMTFCRTSLQASRSLARRLDPFVEHLVGSPVGRALMAQLIARPGQVPPEDAALAIRGLARAEGFHETLEATLVDRDSGAPVPCPLTVAWGTHDRLMLPRQADRARRVLPTATHVWLHGCGHVPTWDDPDAVARVVLDASERSQQPREPAAA